MKKVVLVTGCSLGGIGYDLCAEFARQGCQVYATARRVEAMEGLDKLGCNLVALDVTKIQDIKRVINQIVASARCIDVLVNNAGMMVKGSCVDSPTVAARKVMDVNFFAVLDMVQQVAPVMIKQRSGSIINMGSMAGYYARPFGSCYASSKFALRGYTDSLRAELSPFNVSVTYVGAGYVATKIVNKAAGSLTYLPSTSPYQAFPGAVYEVNANEYETGLGRFATAPVDFSRGLVSMALSKRPPAQYFDGLFWWMGWLPGSFVPLWMQDIWSRKFYGLEFEQTPAVVSWLEGLMGCVWRLAPASQKAGPAAAQAEATGKGSGSGSSSKADDKPVVDVQAEVDERAAKQLYPSQRAQTTLTMMVWLTEALLLPTWVQRRVERVLRI